MASTPFGLLSIPRNSLKFEESQRILLKARWVYLFGESLFRLSSQADSKRRRTGLFGVVRHPLAYQTLPA